MSSRPGAQIYPLRPALSAPKAAAGEDEWAIEAPAAQSGEGAYPYTDRLAKKAYLLRLRALQVELIKLQAWIRSTGQRLVVLFEGRDAAGKGGAIKRFTEHLNPRSVRVVSLNKPSETQRGQWYFQRYIEQFPTAGEAVLFDRSWYNRAGVERVMGFCTPEEYEAFFPQAAELERNLVQSGFLLFKLWFDVSRREQRRRILARSSDPLKQWKLSPIDLHALEKWDEYTIAERKLFELTATEISPWICIKSDCKRRARLEAILWLLREIDYDGKDERALAPCDPTLVTVIATR